MYFYYHYYEIKDSRNYNINHLRYYHNWARLLQETRIESFPKNFGHSFCASSTLM